MGVPPKEIAERIDDISDFSGLGEFLDVPFRTYSTGMQPRLAFAASTSINPEILFTDEWLSTGAEDFKERANQRMRELVDSTQILELASHSRDLLERWLELAQLKMDGRPKDVLSTYFAGE